MGRTVGELLDSVSYRELLQWGEYCAIEPFGEWRADVRNAHLVSVIANVNRDPKKRQEPFGIADFMLKFDGPKKEPVNAEAGATVSPATIAWLFTKGNKKRGL